MKEIVKTSRLAGQLEKLYRMLNEDWFGGALTPPIISIIPSSRAYGSYSLYDPWNVKGEGKREINISSVYLNRPIEEVVGTMAHEMTHQLNHEVLNIQDTSNRGVYHNKFFRRTAESHGLTVTRSERYGWSHTEPSDALLAWILENDIPEIRMNRDEPYGVRIPGGAAAANGGAKTTGGTKGHYRRFVCPVCGLTARTTRAAKLICGDCLTPMMET